MGWLVILSGSSVKVSDVLDEIDSTLRVLPKICAQIQCAEYEKIVDAVNDVLKSELRMSDNPLNFDCPCTWKGGRRPYFTFW